MTSDIQVTNTLAFVFPPGAAQPNLDEMARFVKTLTADRRTMETAYKISDERSVFIKFNSEAAMKKALAQNPAKRPFHYSNGKVVEVSMFVAGGNIRYVRVFDLPPEVTDLDLTRVLEKFGKINRIEHEMFPPNHGLDMSTGVRGIHMDIEKDIPSILPFGNRKGRIFYEQMKLTCYLCQSEGHLKAACPKKKSSRQGKNTNEQQQKQEQQSSSSYADVVGAASSQENKPEKESESEIEMLEEECEAVAVDTEIEKQSQKRPFQQQKQTVRHYQQKPLKYGNWTEYVQLHTKLLKEQQRTQQSINEASPPRKNQRPNSPRSGSRSN